MEISQLRLPCLQSDSELLITADTVDAVLSKLITYRLNVTADLESRGLATELGANNTVELLSLRHRRNRGDIRRDLKFLKNLPKYEAVIAALPDPHADDNAVVEVAVLTPDLARVIVATLEKAPPTVPVEDLRVAEEQLIEAARHLTPDELRDFGRQVLDRLDTDGPEPAEEAAAQAENLWIRPVDHGLKFGGFLSGENAEQFQTAIHDLAKPHKTIDGDPDPRSRDKRQADALITILETAIGNTSGPGIPHITVTIDFADLKALTSEAVGELVFGDNLSASAVRRLACDAFVLPIVLGTDSQPLDVGMDYRFVTRPIRRALIRRDKGCVICKAPPSHCHAHHIIHWVDGGPTSITNLVLLCGAHHRAVHAGHWSVKISDGVIQVTRPEWTVPTPGRLT
ncbi:HNH endonuclease signature motif containing protein, partial [Streptomyces sp. SID13031]|uniref:HNH endonuclease signature motif containing protein n=1 Tax=Streptomyces sp. SID13031 TaxID=2706046 RepID=UPI0013CBA667